MVYKDGLFAAISLSFCCYSKDIAEQSYYDQGGIQEKVRVMILSRLNQVGCFP